MLTFRSTYLRSRCLDRLFFAKAAVPSAASLGWYAGNRCDSNNGLLVSLVRLPLVMRPGVSDTSANYPDG